MKMLNNNGPKIEPGGAPVRMFPRPLCCLLATCEKPYMKRTWSI